MYYLHLQLYNCTAQVRKKREGKACKFPTYNVAKKTAAAITIEKTSLVSTCAASKSVVVSGATLSSHIPY